ncbi:MAG TPA: DUF559 domain-containing protein, partial [Mycobacteriales bacterium]|nr:DUF559 domain-containing protein [Mycobacteriales bacterium]
AADRRRDNWLAQQGWLILRFTADDVLKNPDDVARQVREASTRRGRSFIVECNYRAVSSD